MNQNMKLVPLLKCQDLKATIAFYTDILDFKRVDPDEPDNDWAVDLTNGEIDLQLTVLDSGAQCGSVVNVWVDDLDALVATYTKYGLDQSYAIGSPVHQGPVDQTWGTREFYVTDPGGNTLRFRQSSRHKDHTA